MEVYEPGPSGFKTVTRMNIYNIMRESEGHIIKEKLQYVEHFLLGKENYTEDETKVFKYKMSLCKSQFLEKWSGVSRDHHRFIQKYEILLKGDFELHRTLVRPGRPVIPFHESCARSKRRKTATLLKNVACEELVFATESKLRSCGKRDAAKVLEQLNESPKWATKYKKAYAKDQERNLEKFSTLEALSRFVEAGLSRRQYEIMKTKQYPCYSRLQQAKKLCYSKSESYFISENCAEIINLQDLLDHTSERLILYLAKVVQTLTEKERVTMQLSSKWGCGGSQQSRFRQKSESDSYSDANIFLTSMVPLQLICETNNKIIWRNPTPSSPRYCRPIRIRFIKESTDIINEEIEYTTNKIKELKPTHVSGVTVKRRMMFTMVDGKVCNAATETKSSLKCYICGASSMQFNDLDREAVDDENAYKFGLSIVHARIRFLECLLHISYKLPIKKWKQKLDADEKNLIRERKKKIQEELKKEMGILVDIPKAGFGTTNDGNTSRRFFSNTVLSSAITRLDYTLIFRLKVILETISSGHKIDTEKFAKYALDTAKLYVEKYPWQPMTPTLHKVLIHGPAIIKNALLPIGQLSEEAAEARNKHFREYRLNYARKFSREACNRDVTSINRLLLTSDPLLTSIRPKTKNNARAFSKECIELLLPGEIQSITKETDDETEDETEKEKEGEEAEMKTHLTKNIGHLQID